MAEQRERCRREWTSSSAQVAGWVEPNDWVTKPYAKRMRDADGTIYEVRSLFLQKGPTRLLLHPIAYDVCRDRGDC